ncbi:MAG: M48 family metallopeptidase [Bacteroidales bacterium]
MNQVNIEIEKIIRTKRKTFALQVTHDATLIIKVPLNIDDKTIEKIILKHKKWIEQKKEEVLKRGSRQLRKEFVNGEEFLFMGRNYRLKIVDDQGEPLKLVDEFLLSRSVLTEARETFTGWYKRMAYEVISERVRWYAGKKGEVYNAVKITGALSRWGSCSAGGNLNFSWRLVMAPLPVIDYVVIHELVHLEEKNHSKAFWNKVKFLMPDYEEHKCWLKNNGYLLLNFFFMSFSQ